MTKPAPAAPPAQLGEPAAGRWAALFTLALVAVLAISPWFSAAAVLPQLRELWALTPAQGAWLTLSVQFGFVLGALLSAALNLADLLSPRRLILLGALVAAVSNALVALDPGFQWAVVLRVLTGVGLAGVYPPALKAMSTWFRTGRGLALGVMVGALSLGSALPHLVNGLGGAQWRPVILVTSVLALAGGLIAARSKDGPFPFPPAVFDPRQGWRLMTQPAVRLTTVGYLGHMWELYAVWAWFAVYYADVLRAHGTGEPARIAALAAFVVIGAGAAGCVVGGVLGDRWGRTRLTALSMLLSGGCALLLALLPGAPPTLVLAVGVFWGFWVVADSAQFSTALSEIADARYVGTALTLQMALGFLLTAVTISLVPVVQGAVGWSAALAMLAVGPLVGTWAMLRLRHLPEASRIAGGRG